MSLQPAIPYEQTFDGLYGLEVSELGEERVVARVPVRDAVRQPFGLVHGGLFAAMAESTASMGTASAVWDEGKAAMGLANHTSFLRPIVSSAYVQATAVRRHRGRSTWLWDVDITDDEGRLCALSRMTIAVRER